MSIGWSLVHLATDGDLINRFVRRADPSYRVVRNRDTFHSHLLGTRTNERWHLAFLLVGLWTQLLAMLQSSWVLALLLTLSNVVFNLYPVMHQRYKRARVRHA